MGGSTYAKPREYAGIDFFRIFAAVLVIAIHTAPFSVISGDLDFLLTYCLGRIAVPFFLMTTGYFVLGPWKIRGLPGQQENQPFSEKDAVPVSGCLNLISAGQSLLRRTP